MNLGKFFLFLFTSLTILCLIHFGMISASALYNFCCNSFFSDLCILLMTCYSRLVKHMINWHVLVCLLGLLYVCSTVCYRRVLILLFYHVFKFIVFNHIIRFRVELETNSNLEESSSEKGRHYNTSKPSKGRNHFFSTNKFQVHLVWKFQKYKPSQVL